MTDSPWVRTRGCQFSALRPPFNRKERRVWVLPRASGMASDLGPGDGDIIT